MKKFDIGSHEILLAKIENKFYAADNRCPHMGGNLSQGKLEKTVITCPLHHSQFDLSNGQVIDWTDWTGIKLSLVKIFKSPRPLKTYEVKVEGDKVFVDMGNIPAATKL